MRDFFAEASDARPAAALEQLHQRLATLDGGTVADDIPGLSKADPSGFGIAIVTVDGHTRSADIIADTPVAARAKEKLLANRAEMSLARVRQAKREVKILTR